MRFSKPIVAASILLVAASVLGAKIKITGNIPLPAIDANGMINVLELQPATGVLAINTKNGKARVSVTGNVDNLSNAKQKYKNDPAFAEALGIPNDFVLTVKRTLYKVAASGAANAKLSLVVDPP